MRGQFKTALLGILIGCLTLFSLGFMTYQESSADGRVWHHTLAADADLQCGPDAIMGAFQVERSFTSHLPLVVIDTRGEEIVNHKSFDPATESLVYQEGVDPYVEMDLVLIDHPGKPNSLADAPTMESHGRIKIRGNNSASYIYPKVQYLLKLEDEAGEKNPLAILGMEPSDTWVLNGTMSDKSYLRNYLAFNLAGELDPFTPDVRMCEAVFRSETGYEYLGLYGMYEKVEQGEGRVDIPAVSNPPSISDYSYILKRDRREPDGLSMAVWSTVRQNPRNWISLEYPDAEAVTQEYWEEIQREIQTLEEVLYSDQKEVFITYRSMLDVESFVDYFIINEFLCNYDAGRNSTYLYKNEDNKIAIGPVWDFDNALDNERAYQMDFREIRFTEQPWFDRLVRDEVFNAQLQRRYRTLRAGILHDETMERVIREAARFLQRPASRDRSRWDDVNPHVLGSTYDQTTRCFIPRDQETWEEEVEKLRQITLLHAEYLDGNLETELDRYEDHTPLRSPTGGVLLITAFFVVIVLVLRGRNERR